MIQLGPYQVSAIETGQFALDGGAMFGSVPKTLWAKTNPADAENRIDMRLRAMLIQKPADALGERRNILIDCGIGTKWSEKFSKIYKIDHSQWSLLTELGLRGLKPEDITDIVLTHLHFDHCGGMTSRSRPDDPTSELVPTFINAKVYLQKRNWELAWKPSEKDRASYLQENFALYQDEPALARKLELIETTAVEPSGRMLFSGPDSQETQILPGISVLVSHGHTLGLQVIRVADPAKPQGPAIYYCADLIPTASHVRVPFVMGYDCYPLFIMEEKKQLLARAFKEKSMLFYEHCPRMHASTIITTPKGDYDAGDPISF